MLNVMLMFSLILSMQPDDDFGSVYRTHICPFLRNTLEIELHPFEWR